MTELQNNRMTEGQTGQIQYSPHFFKAGFANLQKMTIYNTNVDLVNDNVYTKFG